MDEKHKKLSIIGFAILLVALLGGTYAFFNYTRTGTANNIRTGRIYFNTTQGEELNLTNVFPMKSSEAESANLDAVTVGIAGDTTYADGEEFEITLTGLNNTVNGKEIPINYIATYTAATGGSIGESSDTYFTARESKDANIYKLNATGKVVDGKQVLTGYIKNGTTGISGTLTIKAYIDADRIAISDTYYENAPTPRPTAPSDEYGTTTEWVDGRVVLTTEEWNSLGSTPISFKIKAESNEGIWVEEQSSRNDMIIFNNGGSNNVLTIEQMQSIVEINFIKMSETMINTHTNLIDLTNPNGEGIVKAWIENNILYIVSPGITYFPTNCSGLFANNFTNLTNINFNNIDVSEVTEMNGMFQNCSKLQSLDLSNYNTNEVTSAYGMFNNCTNLVSVALSAFSSNITRIDGMFYNCSKLTTIYVNNNWNVSGANNSSNMFGGCTSLKGGGSPQTTYDANHVDKEYARIDGGANSATPGYLTLRVTG